MTHPYYDKTVANGYTAEAEASYKAIADEQTMTNTTPQHTEGPWVSENHKIRANGYSIADIHGSKTTEGLSL